MIIKLSLRHDRNEILLTKNTIYNNGKEGMGMSVHAYPAKKGRNNKMWRINIYRGKGQRRITQAGFRTQSEAKEVERQIIRNLSMLQDTSYYNATIEYAFELMIINKKQEGIKEVTLRGYRCEFEKIFGTKYYNEKINSFTTDFLQNLLNECCKHTTGKRELKFLRTFFKYAFDHNWIFHNPSIKLRINDDIEKTEKAKEKQRRISKKRNWLETKEYNVFIKSLNNWSVYEQDKMLLKMALVCGLRQGELRGLQLRDIDREKLLVHINRQYNSENEYTPPKAGIKRKVGISKEFLEEIDSFLENKKKRYERKGWKITDETPFFNSRKEEICIGKEYLADVVRKFYRNHKKLNLNRITPHGLRHTFASKLYNDGTLNLREISTILGHNSIKTTTDYYIHTFDIKYEEIQQKMYA